MRTSSPGTSFHRRGLCNLNISFYVKSRTGEKVTSASVWPVHFGGKLDEAAMVLTTQTLSSQSINSFIFQQVINELVGSPSPQASTIRLYLIRVGSALPVRRFRSASYSL